MVARIGMPPAARTLLTIDCMFFRNRVVSLSFPAASFVPYVIAQKWTSGLRASQSSMCAAPSSLLSPPVPPLIITGKYSGCLVCTHVAKLGWCAGVRSNARAVMLSPRKNQQSRPPTVTSWTSISLSWTPFGLSAGVRVTTILTQRCPLKSKLWA
jgi:hypothetical protein